MAQVSKVTMKLVICLWAPWNQARVRHKSHKLAQVIVSDTLGDTNEIKMHQVRRKSDKRLDGDSLRSLYVFQQRGVFSFQPRSRKSHDWEFWFL